MAYPNPHFSPARHGLPTRAELVEHRIWDMHYHGMYPPQMAGGKSLARQNEETFEFVDRMGVEVVCPFIHVGLGTAPADRPSAENDRQIQEVFARWRDRFAGHLWVSPAKVAASLEAIDRWIVNGPMVGLKFGGEPGALPASHPNFEPLIRRATELNATVYIHAWYLVSGNPPQFGGRRDSVSNPQDVVELAKKFPNTPLICGHGGGDWAPGIRAIRAYPNIIFEVSGSDPHSGTIDMAVRELGAERIVWGGHVPSRSYSNELSKVFDADLTPRDRKLILGGNLRRLLAPMFRSKGLPLTV